MHTYLVLYSACFCLSGFSLYILVLHGALLCSVMSHCRLSVRLLQFCLHQLSSALQNVSAETLWSCATSNALQLLRHLCKHCAPSKTSFITDTTVGANIRSTQQIGTSSWAMSNFGLSSLHFQKCNFLSLQNDRWITQCQSWQLVP